MKKILSVLALLLVFAASDASAAGLIGEERAAAEALRAAKVQRSDVRELKTELRRGAASVYAVSFEYGSMNYVCEIGAETGEVVSVSTRPFRKK